MQFKKVEKKCEGKFITRYDITYETVDHQKKVYEMISRNGDITDFEGLHGKMADAVVIIATDETGEKILIDKEFRLAPGEWVYNFPAGLIDPGETPQESAKRELREETGLELYEIDDFIGTSYSAVGFSNETNVCVVGKARGEFHKSTSTLEEIEPAGIQRQKSENFLRKQNLQREHRHTAMCGAENRG